MQKMLLLVVFPSDYKMKLFLVPFVFSAHNILFQEYYHCVVLEYCLWIGFAMLITSSFWVCSVQQVEIRLVRYCSEIFPDICKCKRLCYP